MWYHPFCAEKIEIHSCPQTKPWPYSPAGCVLQPYSLPREIESAGEAFLMLCMAEMDKKLSTLHNTLFVGTYASNEINLDLLPRNKDVAKYPSFRTYQQVQEWVWYQPRHRWPQSLNYFWKASPASARKVVLGLALAGRLGWSASHSENIISGVSAWMSHEYVEDDGADCDQLCYWRGVRWLSCS